MTFELKMLVLRRNIGFGNIDYHVQMAVSWWNLITLMIFIVRLSKS